ncbi:hypothetical protein HET73_01175 [Wolbachia endosymbiont of Atemnus politus]|nr:hypothetical protein [Wolbachia endosymbiont of Atemnus politus]
MSYELGSIKFMSNYMMGLHSEIESQCQPTINEIEKRLETKRRSFNDPSL